ncbi:hypothetical protein KPL71_023276 [Citrus sinensis]|uniref:Uncharacterized protein n=1 Tax=Citrus sinensis TaxID=2711 RepID=A0ACB8II10_CITSI|nr:hypothetical protein KPL71_023276 [Citrus sinensis]
MYLGLQNAQQSIIWRGLLVPTPAIPTPAQAPSEKKRLNQIESARGKRRVHLVGKYSMKMKKYERAARAILTPKVGYGLADELERAGFWVRTVSNKPQAAHVLLRNHMVDVMDKRRIECFIVVPYDLDFVEVLLEAELRGWEEELDCDNESENANVDDIIHADDADCIQKEDKGAWWKLESSDAEATS